jgi:hypothetical protein
VFFLNFVAACEKLSIKFQYNLYKWKLKLKVFSKDEDDQDSKINISFYELADGNQLAEFVKVNGDLVRFYSLCEDLKKEVANPRASKI